MADQDFQVIISSEEYQKLQNNLKKNEDLEELTQKMKQEISQLKVQNKDLTRSVYIRDSYIQQLVAEFESAFGEILGHQIVPQNINESLYQDIISHEQNGMSSIELRHALQTFTSKNQHIFKKTRELVEKYFAQEKKHKELEKYSKQLNLDLEEANRKLKKVIESSKMNKVFEQEQIIKENQKIKTDIEELKLQKIRLDKANRELIHKNVTIVKEIETLSKKRDTSAEKSYVIKLMVDEYYSDLEQSLNTIGGLSDEQVGTVVYNQMKGIVHYINALCKKAKN